MKVFIQSDLHYDFFKNDLGYDHQTYFEKFFLHADVLVVAGDFANGLKISLEIIKYLAQKYKQVILTFGNHDICITPSIEPDFTFSSIYEKISFAKGEISKIKNVHLLDGNIFEYDGFKFGGCMGFCDLEIYSEVKQMLKFKWKKWFDGRNWKGDYSLFNDVYEDQTDKMHNCVKTCDMMITHFCPHITAIPPQFSSDINSAYFYFEMKDFFPEMKAKYWVFGHTHDAYKIEKNGKLFLCNPIGYPFENPFELNSLKREDFLIEV